MIMRATKWSAGYIVSINETGARDDAFSGAVEKVEEKVRHAVTHITLYQLGDSLTSLTRPCTREEFFAFEVDK